MMGYGTGAIMAVPAHDERDYAFAKTFGLPIVEVINGRGHFQGSLDRRRRTGQFRFPGRLGRGGFQGQDDRLAGREEARQGTGAIPLRDWLFSRQRYWGEPFPLVHTG